MNNLKQSTGKTNSRVGRPKELFVVRPGKELPKLLYGLLSVGTPHRTGSETLMHKYLPPRDGKSYEFSQDTIGNMMYCIGDVTKHKTAFSCHMDTVHRVAERIFPLTDNQGYIYGATRSKALKSENPDDKYMYTPSVLGADDKIGMYIMLMMIKAKVPGLYIFHVGEECGGVGSKSLAKTHKSVFEGIDRVIAFDRAKYTSVITKQTCSKCCSDKFGNALAAALNKNMPTHSQFKLDTGGSFTDSANYTDIVPECTNLSVGYFDQHTKNECFDYIWLESIFLPALLKVDWSKLPTDRKPGDDGWSRTYDRNTNSYINSAYDTKYLSAHTVWNRVPPFTRVYIKEVVDNLRPPAALAMMLRKSVLNTGVVGIDKLIAEYVLDYYDAADEVKTLEAKIEELQALEAILDGAALDGKGNFVYPGQAEDGALYKSILDTIQGLEEDNEILMFENETLEKRVKQLEANNVHHIH